MISCIYNNLIYNIWIKNNNFTDISFEITDQHDHLTSNPMTHWPFFLPQSLRLMTVTKQKQILIETKYFFVSNSVKKQKNPFVFKFLHFAWFLDFTLNRNIILWNLSMNDDCYRALSCLSHVFCVFVDTKK